MTKVWVEESDRGPAIPESRLDQDAFVNLACAVMQRALEDLDTRAYRNSARRFLLHDYPHTLWSDFCTVNEAKLRSLVRARCRQRPPLKGVTV